MTPSPERLAQLFGKESVGALELRHHVPGLSRGMPVVSPDTLAAACEVLRFAARERLHVLPAGAGEHLYLGAAPGPVDFVLSTRRLDRILEYEPEDMVLVAQAGVTLHAVDAVAAPHGQRLPVAAWPGRAATLGGAAAAQRAGLDRLACGTLRDVVLGVRVVHADGRMSKTGGKVVKNVAGYDLGKLYVGSYGSLALLAEVNVRLAPRPPSVALVAASCERRRAREALLAVRRSVLQPSALLLVAGHTSPLFRVAPHRVLVLARFEGLERAVRSQVATCVQLMGGEELPAETAAAAWEHLRAFGEAPPDAVQLRIHGLPIAACDFLDGFAEVAHVGDGFLAQFGVGMAHLRLSRAESAHLEKLAAYVARHAGRLVVEHAPSGSLPPPHEDMPEAERALHAGLKRAFDPSGILPPAPVALDRSDSMP